MPRQLTYDEIAELADIISLANPIAKAAPFEMARVILEAGYRKAAEDA